MSGGSYNYMYCRIEEEYVDRMYDSQLNEVMKDLCKLLHDLEKQIESELERTKSELLKEFDYLKDVAVVVNENKKKRK